MKLTKIQSLLCVVAGAASMTSRLDAQESSDDRLLAALADAEARSLVDERRGQVGGPGIPEGYVLFEGDMIIPEQDYWSIVGGYSATFLVDLWVGGEVPYEFDEDTMSAGDIANALAAMADWESVAAVDFLPRDGHPSYLFIRNSDQDSSPSCSSMVGMQGGQQTVNLTTNCLSTFSVHHELGHALGYLHEQTRADRDVFVTINWCNIQDSSSCGPNTDGKSKNFQIMPATDQYGQYDFDSVMHYPAGAFAVCGTVTCGSPDTCPSAAPCTTIDVKPPNDVEWQSKIGQRNHLSKWDEKVMSFLYSESDWRFLDTSLPFSILTDGSFLKPWTLGLQPALDVQPEGGDLIILNWNQFPAMEIAKPMTIRAPLGGVVFGEE